MQEKRKILIAEDEKLLRAALEDIILSSGDLAVAGLTGDGHGAVAAARELAPDLVLMDVSMPGQNGLEATAAIKAENPRIKVLLLTVHDSDEYILEAFRAGADGYCLKDAGREELLTAIRTVLKGRRYLGSAVSDKVMEGYLEDRKTLKTRSSWESLTNREREVLRLIARSYKNRDIGRELGIAIKTVEKHRSNIMQKLDLHTSSDLTAYALERGILDE